MAEQPESYNFVKALYVEKYEYPLYDNHENPVEYYFSAVESLVWQPPEHKGGPDRATPVAVTPKTKFRLALADGAEERLRKDCVEPVHLVGTYNGITVFHANDILRDNNTVTIVTPTKDGITKPLPLALIGNINWTVTGMKNKTARYEHDTDARIYIFPENLPSYYDNIGISLPLLRNNSFLPRWMQQTGSAAKDLTWPAFVVDTMFNHCKFQYETWSGASKYVSYFGSYTSYKNLFRANAGLNFWIDLFTSDSVYVADVHQLNCYDLAAVCQAFIALGVDQSVANLKMVYLEPYGYIKDTRLIGRFETDKTKLLKNPTSLCNNPFYMNTGYDPEMLCKPDSSTRSKFGNHMFLSLKKGATPYIFDACAGPHTGTEDLANYIRNSIDPTPSLYARSTMRPGTTSNAQTGMGIQRLVTSRAFEKKSSVGRSESMLDNLAQSVNEQGEWTQPFLSFPFTQNRCTATWTFVRQDKKDTYWINVFKYSALTALKMAFGMRTGNTPGYTPTPGKTNEGYTDDASGSVIIWCDEKRLYMATIEAKVGKALTDRPIKFPPTTIPALSVFKDKFQVALNSRLDIPKPPGDVIQKWEATDKTGDGVVTHLGSTIDLDIYSEPRATDYWRGFMVLSETGNMLFLGAEPSAKTTVTRFKLFARRKGNDDIIFILFGSRLDFEQKRIKFTVKA